MNRPKIFDEACENKPIWERLLVLADYLGEAKNFPTEEDWLDRWENVKQYLRWLVTER